MLPLLDVSSLKMHFSTMQGTVKAVDGVSFSVNKGEALGFAGESGCGKTSMGLTVMRILPDNGRIIDGTMNFDGVDLRNLNEDTLRRRVRWKRISMVFQGAMNAFTPVHRIGFQISEAILAHERTTKQESMDRARKLLSLVGINPDRVSNYPHEFSGGMKQRAMIAMALSCNPDMVILDEPTTALDVIVQAQVIDLLKQLREKLRISFMMISHDISAMAQLCDKLAVMYAGEIVEQGTTSDVFTRPAHPYTQGLIAAFPSIKGPKRRLAPISGSPPNLLNPPQGCRFHPRCPFAMDICREKTPEITDLGNGHVAACHLLNK